LVEGKTIGSPFGLMIKNKDWENWQEKEYPPLTTPRPGHTDFSGAIKYGFKDLRKVLERASARQTAMRVAIGSVAGSLLEEFNIEIYSYVLRIGQVKAKRITFFNREVKEEINKSPVYCVDGIASIGEVVIRAYLKPIPTLINPLRSIDFTTKKETKAIYQRSDICVVPAASIVGEAVAAWEIAAAFLEKFGGDSLAEIKKNYENYKESLRMI